MTVNLQISVGVHHAQGLGWISPGLEAQGRGERGSEGWVWEGVAAIAPGNGEAITFCYGDDDDDSTLRMAVSRRELVIGPRGGQLVNIELVDWHVDPSEAMQRHCTGTYRRAWHTDENDGDLDAILEACGFRPW